MTYKEKFKVAGIGELLWDLLPDGKKFGGAPANFAFHAQSLGAESSIVSSVGNDDLGKEILNFFKSLSLNSEHVEVNPLKQTGLVNVTLTDGIPEYEIKTDVAWDYIQWTKQLEKLAGSVDAVCFGSLAQRSDVSHQTILKFLKATRSDCLRIFDINLRQDFFTCQIITSSLEMASILKLNDEELPVVAGFFSLKGSESVILEQLINQFDLQLIALTKGKKGSLLKTKTEESFLEVPEIKVKDTVGAGDAFTAALIMAKLNDKTIEEMHKFANEVASFVCTCDGATPVLPEYLVSRIS